MTRRTKRLAESTWVGFLNSDRWRRFAKAELVSRTLHSRGYQSADTFRRYVLTSLQSIRHPDMFNDVQTVCLFIGHVKSGGTMIGSLLDAHPSAIVADEIDMVRYVEVGFRRDQIFHLLLKGSRRDALKGRVTARRLTPYSFAVPGQWQGSFARLQVIGASRAGPTTRTLGNRPELIRRLNQVMEGAAPKYVHVVRNPYDPISTMVVRGQRTFENAIDDYFAQCRRLVELRSKVSAADVFEVRYEEFVRNPVAHLEDVCHFLGLRADADYLSSAAGIIEASRPPERDMVRWTPDRISSVEEKIGSIGFLTGYAHGAP